MQRCPVVPNAPQSTPSSASSRSASSSTICAFLPPISSDSRLCIRPHVSPTTRPVSVDPVNEITGTSGCSTIAAPTVSPLPCTSWMTSGGSPASSRISTSTVAGVRHVLGRLEDDRVSAEQRREHLPRGDRHREVERRDEPADADRPAEAHRPLVPQLARHRVPEQPAPLGRGVVRGVDAFLHVAARLRERLAHLARHEVRDLFLARRQQVADAAQHVAARGRGRAPPDLEAALRATRRRGRRRRRPRAGKRPITSLVSAGLTFSKYSPVDGSDPLAADEVLEDLHVGISYRRQLQLEGGRCRTASDGRTTKCSRASRRPNGAALARRSPVAGASCRTRPAGRHGSGFA